MSLAGHNTKEEFGSAHSNDETQVRGLGGG
jgi:hypothetical protein